MKIRKICFQKKKFIFCFLVADHVFLFLLLTLFLFGLVWLCSRNCGIWPGTWSCHENSAFSTEKFINPWALEVVTDRVCIILWCFWCIHQAEVMDLIDWLVLSSQIIMQKGIMHHFVTHLFYMYFPLVIVDFYFVVFTGIYLMSWMWLHLQLTVWP